jgi:dihydrofolate reductase
MRRIVVMMQTTLNNRIANADGGFWKPFPWGEKEMAYLNQFFRAADTWALSRKPYEVIVPWWDQVARGELPEDAPTLTAADLEFAALLAKMTRVVFSNRLEPASDRVVMGGNFADQLAAVKGQDGKNIMLSCGPARLAQLAGAQGLVDEYLLSVHPAVISAGPQLFQHVAEDIALRLVEAKMFDAGCALLHYEVVSA